MLNHFITYLRFLLAQFSHLIYSYRWTIPMLFLLFECSIVSKNSEVTCDFNNLMFGIIQCPPMYPG